MNNNPHKKGYINKNGEFIICKPPKKVFILENNIYVEITNEEHERRKVIDFEYTKKVFTPIHGCLMETTKEFHDELKVAKDRERYVARRSMKRDFLYSQLDTDEMLGEDMLEDPQDDICTQIIEQEEREIIRNWVEELPKDEFELIDALFYKELSETDYSKITGYSQQRISYQKLIILKKFKNFIKNSNFF